MSNEMVAHSMVPLCRETARQYLSKKIRKKDGSAEPIKILGITDEGAFLGELECGPFITYKWMLEHCVWDESGEPCGAIMTHMS